MMSAEYSADGTSNHIEESQTSFFKESRTLNYLRALLIRFSVLWTYSQLKSTPLVETYECPEKKQFYKGILNFKILFC